MSTHAKTRAHYEAIFAALAGGRLRMRDLASLLGLTNGGIAYLLGVLEDKHLIHTRLEPDGRWYYAGPDQRLNGSEPDHEARDYDVQRIPTENGRVLVKFGVHHKTGHAQRPGRHASGASSLWSLYE